ncbi:MAG: hypothetical protein C0483_11180 [Pirellula sp.]|nr:hypothetical protein [Pirellula sp.]
MPRASPTSYGAPSVRPSRWEPRKNLRRSTADHTRLLRTHSQVPAPDLFSHPRIIAALPIAVSSRAIFPAPVMPPTFAAAPFFILRRIL